MVADITDFRDFLEYVTAPYLFEERQREFVREFISSTTRPKYILGRNIYSREVSRQIYVDGFVDDFTKETSFAGKPILSLSSVPKDSLVLNAACGRPLTAKYFVEQMGIRQIDYFSFLKLGPLNLPEISFNAGFRRRFSEFSSNYFRIYSLLEDSVSKSTYIQLLRFRYRLCLDDLVKSGFRENQENQYFEDFLELGNNPEEVFVDIGCFDGETSLKFARVCPSYKSIVAFEPDAENARNCEINIGGLREVKLLNMGLGSKKAKVALQAAGSASCICEGGSKVVEIDSLDSVLSELNICPTYLKMDIEGYESLALLGARDTILKTHPKIALCVYHSPRDLWGLATQVLSVRNDYAVYVRHYTESIYETVMFFVPKK